MAALEKNKHHQFLRWWLLGLVLLLFITTIGLPDKSKASVISQSPNFKEINKVSLPKDSIDKQTGLIVAPGHKLVVKNCLRCHSPQLITNKRASREGWLATIRWMQQTQGLPDLGKEEPLILEYLTKNYAPTYEGRRPRLKNIEWYKL